MSVQDYVDKHMLQQKVEQAVNACVKERPSEPLSYLGKYMISKAPFEIVSIVGRQILDSRGNPTVEADVETYQGSFRGAVPSGASTGSHEAHELRDKDKSVYLGKGVLKAVENINTQIAPALKGKNPMDQKAIDELLNKLDGTEDKRNLGANAILAVSIACARAGASAKGMPLYQHLSELAGNKNYTTLPVPAFNIINGGSHAGNALAFQEFMILPIGAKSFSEALQIGAEVYHTLKSIIKSEFGIDATNVGDEGGFAPPVTGADHSCKMIDEAIKKAGHQGKVFIGLDCAASEFFNESDKTYDLNFKAEKNDGAGKKSGEELLAMYKKLVSEYPVVSIEDPFFEDDWDNFAGIVKENLCLIVGDDLLVTNPKLIKKAIDTKSASALLLKVNQIGTVSESIEAVKLAKSAGWAVMTSHRSGETEDTFIADLSVGLATGLIKSGAPCRSERNAKYNQLLRIETELKDNANYTGESYKHIPIGE